MMPMPSPAAASPKPFDPRSSGGVLVSTEGRILPLVGASLRAEAGGGIARGVLEQRFRNVYDVPLTVTYSFPLPADGAVSGFAFRIGDRRIVGEIDRREAARERFEEAILEGKSAALLEHDRSSLFTQEVGNIPPGAEVVAEIVVDQRLRWLDEGAWEWRFPTAVAPRYLGAEGRVADAERVTQHVAEGPLAARLTLSLHVRDRLVEGGRPESPSHALHADELSDVRFVDANGVGLDRDVVVRWRVATDQAATSLEVARRGADEARAYALLTIVPPRVPTRSVARDVIVLLDTSGSMGGGPLAQARRVVSAIVDTLGDADRLEMIEFSSSPRRWTSEPVAATREAKQDALAWLASRRASGGTEMRDAIVEALGALRPEAQRQVVLVTDGFIGFEAEVVGAIAGRGAKGTRVHAVGVGSAVNRSLTSAAARAGNGVEVIVGLGEDPEPAAKRLVARTDAPLIVDLEIAGGAFVAHAGLPDLYAGTPALVPLAVRPEGGELTVRGRTAEGPWAQRVEVSPVTHGAGRAEVMALFGREQVEALEARVAAGERALDSEIERIGLDFAIATRLTSWVAIAESPSVDPQGPTRRERMPQALPHGLSAEGLGLRAAAGRPAMAFAMAPPMMAARMPAPRPQPKAEGILGRVADAVRAFVAPQRTAAPPPAPPRSVPPQDVPPAAAPTAGGTAMGRVLRGQVVRGDGRRMVVEIAIDGEDLAWEPPALVIVEWADGASVEVPVDLAPTTRASTVRAGERVRLVLQTDPADTSRRLAAGLRFVLHSVRFRVTL
jgi:Ca-activated chloride channel family protein